MSFTRRIATAALLGAACTSAFAAEPANGLQTGTPDIKSAGPLAFGPDGLLFVADAKGAAVFAIDTGKAVPAPAKGAIKVEGVNKKVAAALGTTPEKILINDLAIDPSSGRAYLSVSRGTGPDAAPAIVRVDGEGGVDVLAMQDVPFAKATLPNPTDGSARGGRAEAITDIALVDGKVFVAGLSNEEFSSRLLAIPFPFVESGDGTSLEIFHGAHGRYETKSPIRTFVPYVIGGEPCLLAAYTCTPLVKIPLADLKPGVHVKGTTLAELGNRNKPLDLVAYTKDGQDYLLMANSSRGVMKIAAAGAAKADAITQRVADKEGLPYETIAALKGVVQLDRLDAERAVVLLDQDGSMNLETIPLP